MMFFFFLKKHKYYLFAILQWNIYRESKWNIKHSNLFELYYYCTITTQSNFGDYLVRMNVALNWQIRGHHIAKLDPLGINSADLDDRHPQELLYNHYSFGKPINERVTELIKQRKVWKPTLTSNVTWLIPRLLIS